MNNSNMDELHLSCPACGESLTAVPGTDDQVGCIADHVYTLPTLIFGQSMRASALIEAGARLLDEQKSLVQAIASMLHENHADAAHKLMEQAEKLNETITNIRSIINDGVLASQPLKGMTSDPSLN